MTTVLVIQPGFPAEVPYYVRGLKRMGARVVGVGDQPQHTLSPVAAEGLDAYLQVGQLWHLSSLLEALAAWDLPVKIDQVICLWEAAMELTAEVRKAFGVPGLDREQTHRFRDKHAMRQALDDAGIRNPRYGRASSANEILEVADHVGFPLIIKPAAGAGSASTYRIEDAGQLRSVLPAFRGTRDVVLEEFVVGDEFTFDTLCAGGEILHHSILRYRPTMLESRTEEWISPQNMVLRQLDAPEHVAAYDLGEQVLKALALESGISHMEWFLTPEGEVVFGEIAARPPGGLTGELMNYACDIDIYNAWAECLLHGCISQPIERKYNVAIIFKRAHGHGHIQRIEGLGDIYRQFGEHIVRHDLLPVGAPRRDWKQTLLSDGFVILRHPDLEVATEMSSYVAENLRLYADRSTTHRK